MKIAIVINPISGRRGGASEGQSRAELARRLLRERSLEAEIVLTTAAGDGRRLAAAFVERGFDRVVAWGGDGTVNEVAGPLRRSRTTLGIVPGGSGDGLARSLGLPRGAETALAVALDRPAGAVDVGVIGERHFLNIAGVGFDAMIARTFNQRRRRGGLGYVTGVFSLLWSYRCETYRLQLGDQSMSADRFLIAFANGREYGNGIVIAPDANPSDGWLDAIAVAGGPPIRQLWRARRIAWRRGQPAEGILRMRLQRATIAADRLECHTDGETFDATGSIDVSIDPGAIRIAGVEEARA
jgi:diacylglycerol kinase (ATP)